MANRNLKVAMCIVVEGKLYFHATNIACNTEMQLSKVKHEFIKQLEHTTLDQLESFEQGNG